MIDEAGSHPLFILGRRKVTYFLVGEADAELFGEALAAAAGDAAGIDAAGLAAVEPAVPGATGRSPRLLGLFSMSVASLLTIFDSYNESPSKAVFKSCWR